MKLAFLSIVLLVCSVFAAEKPATSPDSLVQKSDSAAVVDSTVAIADSTIALPASDSSTYGIKEELAMRDSVMAIRDSVCTIEKDSLRKSLELEKAKCDNWQQSYETMKKGNETCAQALSIAIGSQEKSETNKKEAAMMTTTTFFSGIALGMLLFWLIFD